MREGDHMLYTILISIILWLYLWGGILAMGAYGNGTQSGGKRPAVLGYMITFVLWWLLLPVALVIMAIKKRGGKDEA